MNKKKKKIVNKSTIHNLQFTIIKQNNLNLTKQIMNKKFEKERKIYYLNLFHFYDVHKYGGGGWV